MHGSGVPSPRVHPTTWSHGGPAAFVLQPYCNRASTGPYALDNAISRIRINKPDSRMH